MNLLCGNELLSVCGGDGPAQPNPYFEGSSAIASGTLSLGIATVGSGGAVAVTTATAASVPALVVVGAGAAAFGAGYLAGDLIERQTGIGSAVGNWVGSTWVGSYLFNW